MPELIYRRGGAILAFAVPSAGDALKQIMVEVLAPLRPHCDDLVLLDLSDPGWVARFKAASKNPIWFVLSPFGAGEYLDFAGATVNPWAPAGIPFIRALGDTPAYFPSAHMQRSRTSINGYAHAEHRDFFVRWFDRKAPCIAAPLFPFDTIPKQSVDLDRKAASGGIVFPKNGNCPDRLIDYWRASLPPAVAAALQAVAEIADAALDQPTDLMADLQAYFADLGVGLPENQHLMFFLVAQLDDYLRRKKSTLIARSLLDYPVVIRGANWDHVDFHGRRARHDPDTDYDRTRQVLDDSIAILDMSPNTYRGAHDRVLRAAGRYTAFLTNRQQFYVDNFENHRAFTFLFDPDAIRERVETALSRPRDTVEMGVIQGERMRELLTPERFVQQYLTAVDACALACAGRPPGTQQFVHYEPLA